MQQDLPVFFDDVIGIPGPGPGSDSGIANLNHIPRHIPMHVWIRYRAVVLVLVLVLLVIVPVLVLKVRFVLVP